MGPGFATMRLDIHPGCEIPPHFHTKREENWFPLSGSGMLVVDGHARPIQAGTVCSAPRNAVHSIINDGDEPLVLMEIRRGSYLSDMDTIQVSTSSVRQIADDQPVRRAS